MPETDYFSDTQQELREKGLALGKPPEAGELPAGEAQWAVEHFRTYSGISNFVSRTYGSFYDEALRNSRQNAEAQEQDSVIREAMFARKYPTSQIGWQLVPYEESDNAQSAAAAKVTKILRSWQEFDDLRFALLEGIYRGREGAQLLYRWDNLGSVNIHHPIAFNPINGDKLAFKWSGDVGILVNGTYSGKNRETTDRGPAVFLDPAQQEQVVIYKHERRDVSYYKHTQAGAIHGVGVRETTYWPWFLKSNLLAQLLNYVQRFANGIPHGTFPNSDPGGQGKLATAIAGLTNGSAFISPTSPDGRELYTFLVHEVGTANPSFLYSFLRDYFDAQIRRVILGEIEAVGESSGIGGDEAAMKMDSLAGIRRWDSKKLDVALTNGVIKTLYRYNCPGIIPARFESTVDRPNAADILNHAVIIHGLGGEIDLNFLMDTAGLPRPQPGSAVASPVQNLSPVAVGSQPDGVPVAGPGGPQPQDDQQQQSSQQPPQSQSSQTLLDA